MDVVIDQNYLSKVEAYVTSIINEEFSDKLVFHDINLVHIVIEGINTIADFENISDEEREICLIAGWCIFLGFRNSHIYSQSHDRIEYFESCNSCSAGQSELFLSEMGYPHYTEVKRIILDVNPSKVPDTKLGKILSDGYSYVWAGKKGRSRLKLLYHEFLLIGIKSLSKGSFYDGLLEYFNQHQYYTDYGKKELSPKKAKLIAKIKAEQKNIQKTTDEAIKMELSISDSEYKALKKSLNSVKGRDERGIQTMLRTTSRNHYTLNQMVDRKANIMISINAIVLSLILSRIVGNEHTFCVHNYPVLFILIASVISIAFAIISIIPAKTHGQFTEDEIRSKKGNLLYFGNFHNMKFRDYNWGMLQMLNDSEYLYTSMIRDQYFLGQMLSRKYKNIRIALVTFLIGVSLGAVSFLILAGIPEYHLS